MDDVRENEMLHIENSELRYTNRALLAQLDEARAALDKATKSEPFTLNDELQQLRTSNHYMTEELTRLRAERKAEARDLAEARADVQRFEAALDVANRELAAANRERDEFRKQAVKGARGVYLDDKRRRTIAALVVAARALWAGVIDAEMDAPGMKRNAQSRIRQACARQANQATHD